MLRSLNAVYEAAMSVYVGTDVHRKRSQLAVVDAKVQYKARSLKTKISKTPVPVPASLDRAVLDPDRGLWQV
jgi:hypothetical protein